MKTCFRALAAGYLLAMSKLLHVLEPSSDRGPQGNSLLCPVS